MTPSKASAAAYNGSSFMTPPKKTKACNISPGKKPSWRPQVGAGAP